MFLVYQADSPCGAIVLTCLIETGEVEGGDGIFGGREVICHIQPSVRIEIFCVFTDIVIQMNVCTSDAALMCAKPSCLPTECQLAF